MPIISSIGRRNWRVRTVIYGIYAVLLVGAVSMIYPMLLMLSGSVKSDTDHVWISPLPQYLWDDNILWMKYIETKYGAISEAEKSLHEAWGSWRSITPPDASAVDHNRVEAFRSFRAETEWPGYWSRLGDVEYGPTLGRNARRYRKLAQETYPDVAAYSASVGVSATSWSQVGPPPQTYEARHFTFPATANYDLLKQTKASAPIGDQVVINLDGVFWQEFLRPQWATIAAYNASHGTTYSSYNQVLLSNTAPEKGQARVDWEEYVRDDLSLAFIRIDRRVTNAYQRHLASRYDDDIAQLNLAWATSYDNFKAIALPQGAPSTLAEQVDYAAFLKDADACPTEALSIDGPRQGFERYLAQTRGLPLANVAQAALPIPAVDYADFQERTSELRWEFFTRNYIQVLDYLLLHGNGMRNTIIYCALMIVVTLTINPLAAYALSRYHPPSTYKVLLFCMCTMAFPPEVTMIPSFLLLKRFPLLGLAVAAVVSIPLAIALVKLAPLWPDWLKGILSGGAGLIAGFYVLPRMFGQETVGVSLLNTFWALVLPGAANGFSIFLLKGFFDSLPRELYESAEIDGAGEITKFWVITMSLSKPILAVMALQAFIGAYSEFLMALVIIPDPKMWTIMVWLFQLQSQVHPSVVYASLVIAAIPTFLMFLFCQNLIMRGIVVPVEK